MGLAVVAALGAEDESRRREYEMGYNMRSRSRSKKDKEVTGRFREVLRRSRRSKNVSVFVAMCVALYCVALLILR